MCDLSKQWNRACNRRGYGILISTRQKWQHTTQQALPNPISRGPVWRSLSLSLQVDVLAADADGETVLSRCCPAQRWWDHRVGRVGWRTCVGDHRTADWGRLAVSGADAGCAPQTRRDNLQQWSPHRRRWLGRRDFLWGLATTWFKWRHRSVDPAAESESASRCPRWPLFRVIRWRHHRIW